MTAKLIKKKAGNKRDEEEKEKNERKRKQNIKQETLLKFDLRRIIRNL